MSDLTNATTDPITPGVPTPDPGCKVETVMFYEERQGLFQTLLTKIREWTNGIINTHDIITSRYGIVNNPRTTDSQGNEITERFQAVRCARIFYVEKGKTPSAGQMNTIQNVGMNLTNEEVNRQLNNDLNVSRPAVQEPEKKIDEPLPVNPGNSSES